MCNKDKTLHQYTNDDTNFVIICASICIMFIITIAFKRIIYKRSTEFYKQTLSKRRISIISDKEILKANFEELRNKFLKFKALGLDCLWTSTNEKIYLISLAFPDGSSYIIHIQQAYRSDSLCFKTDYYPLVRFFEDPTILKIGLGIIGSSRKIRSDYNISLLGCIDMRNLAVRLRISGVSSLKLDELANNWLHYPYSKDLKFTFEANRGALNKNLIRKVTFKSMVIILCAVEFMCRKKDTNAYYVYNFVNQVKYYCVGIVDKPFSRKPLGFKNYIGTSKEVMIRTFDHPDGIAINRLVMKASVLVASFDNDMLGLDGINTAHSNFVSPFVNGPDLYGSPLIRCNVCYDNENAYITRNIVPLTYRKHIPNFFQKYQKSSDIIHLCFKCHFIYSYSVRELQNILAKELKYPFYPKDFITVQIYKQIYKAKNAARALVQLDSKLSNQRIEELNNQIANCFGNVILTSFLNVGGKRSMMQRMRSRSSIMLFPPAKQSLRISFTNLESNKSVAEMGHLVTRESSQESRGVSNLDSFTYFIPKDILQSIEDIKMIETNLIKNLNIHSSNIQCHGKNIVNWIEKNNAIEDFTAMWRQHFVDSMTPHFLPENWPDLCRHDRFAEMNFCAFNNEDPFILLK